MSEYAHTGFVGLIQRYGVTEAQRARVWKEGDADHNGSEVFEVELDYRTLPTSAAGATIATKFVKIPKGFMIEGGEIIVKTAYTSGGLSTLTVDLVDASDGSSNSMVLENALAKASLVVGAPIALNGAAAAGLTTAADKWVRITVGTADFTAGEGVLRFWGRLPHAAGTNPNG